MNQNASPGRRRRARPNDEISEATRRKLLVAGRRLFASRGYADVSADQIADRAGLTRGALHYQFSDKRGLFEAVVRQLLGELAERVYRETMSQVEEGPDELLRGCEVLLAAYGEPEIQTIALRDAPVVLGFTTWRVVQDEAGLTALLVHALGHWVEAGWIESARVEPLARLLFGALTQAGVAVGEPKDPKERALALARYREEVKHLVHGLMPPRASRTRSATKETR